MKKLVLGIAICIIGLSDLINFFGEWYSLIPSFLVIAGGGTLIYFGYRSLDRNMIARKQSWFSIFIHSVLVLFGSTFIAFFVLPKIYIIIREHHNIDVMWTLLRGLYVYIVGLVISILLIWRAIKSQWEGLVIGSAFFIWSEIFFTKSEESYWGGGNAIFYNVYPAVSDVSFAIALCFLCIFMLVNNKQEQGKQEKLYRKNISSNSQEERAETTLSLESSFLDDKNRNGL